MTTIQTPRLTLISADLGLLDAELAGHMILAKVLGAQIPTDWPPGEYDSDAVGWVIAQLAVATESQKDWHAWYVLLNSKPGTLPILISAAGYFGPPNELGMVEIGYSVCQEYRNRGFATEISKALRDRAFGCPEVQYVQARTTADNAASLKVLRKSGFEAAESAEPEYVRYVCTREPFSPPCA